MIPTALRTPSLAVTALAMLAPVAASQQAILFTGRFPFVSLDAANNNGSIVQMSEYDFSYSVPFPGTAIAGRTLLPATALQSYLGDADGDGDYLELRTWKPSYFTNIGIDGVFVKHGVATPRFSDVYWTPRLDAAAAPLEVWTSNGTASVQLAEGDWVRLLPNGNVEFFLTQAQLATAAGPQVNGDVPAAGALLQSAAGDLYYAPHDGGHWVSGNQTGQVFCYDGAICKIDAANITYDANGNVASIVPDSARLLVNEVGTAPGGAVNVRSMVDNAGAMDRAGQPLVTAGVYGKTGGLGFDGSYPFDPSNPAATGWTPLFPDAAGNYDPEPHLVWCSNAGSYGGTLFTTVNGGDVFEINAFGVPGTGVLCGSKTPGVAADGAWLGVQLDIGNFQPTLLGMTLCALPQQQLVLDQSDYGSLADNVNQPNWEVDSYGSAGTAVFGLISLGPIGAGLAAPSLPAAAVPLGFDPETWPDLFHQTAPISFGLGISDPFGYTTLSVPNPNTGTFTGLTIMVQAVALAAGGFQLSSPVLVQLQ